MAPDMLVDRTKKIANRICAVNQDMLGVVKKLIDYRDKTSLDDAFLHEREGFKAFVETHLKK